ncbi:MAG TPA: flagellar motor protein MotD [Steroidobacteraceae bacterium]|nr:flagellar motor protein MotD [Steroidobacteraceae bacterium]
MARKKKHEEHVNHEAWAIPYGDLVTLLWALFTVMYAMSSVNEGKFRVLSDSLIAAFHGAPKSTRPINIGEKEPGKGGEKPLVGVMPTVLLKVHPTGETGEASHPDKRSGEVAVLLRLERQVQDAMQALIDARLVTVKRESLWLEIEINTDILFKSGEGDFAPEASPVLDKLAEVLKPFPNPIRVEGHTDDRPIRTAAYPSNWELSAARAASVVHEFTKAGIDPLRLEIVGFGEYHPRRPNDSPEGRNANRRVAILVLEAVSPHTPVYVSQADAPAAGAEGAPVAGADGAAKSDRDLADAAGAENRLLLAVPPSELRPTVFKPDATPPHDHPPP